MIMSNRSLVRSCMYAFELLMVFMFWACIVIRLIAQRCDGFARLLLRSDSTNLPRKFRTTLIRSGRHPTCAAAGQNASVSERRRVMEDCRASASSCIHKEVRFQLETFRAFALLC